MSEEPSIYLRPHPGTSPEEELEEYKRLEAHALRVLEGHESVGIRIRQTALGTFMYQKVVGPPVYRLPRAAVRFTRTPHLGVYVDSVWRYTMIAVGWSSKRKPS